MQAGRWMGDAAQASQSGCGEDSPLRIRSNLKRTISWKEASRIRILLYRYVVALSFHHFQSSFSQLSQTLSIHPFFSSFSTLPTWSCSPSSLFFNVRGTKVPLSSGIYGARRWPWDPTHASPRLCHWTNYLPVPSFFMSNKGLIHKAPISHINHGVFKMKNSLPSLGKLLNLSVSSYPHLQNEAKNG